VSARLLVVVSGLPASGKSTVGKALGDQLSLPLLDKDEILEVLFDSLGCEDQEQRYRLSRASDEILFRLAASTEVAVLVNWWNHDTAPARLRAIADKVVEVYCDCPVELASARFAARSRHPGHLDHLRTPADHERGLARLRESYCGPLRVADTVVTIDTAQPVDLDAVVELVRAALPEAFRSVASS
jgi:shikimate kinase